MAGRLATALLTGARAAIWGHWSLPALENIAMRHSEAATLAAGRSCSSSSASSMPNSLRPGIRRSIVDQPFFYAALPPPLIPFIDLVLPVGGQRFLRCLLQVIGLVGGANCMIFAAKRQRRLCSR